MSLAQETKYIAQKWRDLGGTLQNNCEALHIYEGTLKPFIEMDLKEQLSKRAFDVAKYRISPINLLKKVVDKLSQIYTQEPHRAVVGTEQDAKLYEFYEDSMDLNVSMQLANEYFNMHRAVLLEPYLDADYIPRLRAVPYDRFFVCAEDPTDPLKVTHVVKIMGKRNYNGHEKTFFYVYTDKEFVIMDEMGDIKFDIMASYGLDGVNPYGRIPFIYINRSQVQVNPMADTDLMSMTRLVPVMFTDINYALMFQTFSIVYAIDLDTENFEMNPNVLISMKSDPTSGKKPELGQIKPQVDSDKAIAAIQEQIALWLQSRGIKPGTIGRIGQENSSSGISKMVDEMDTTADRRKQIPFFKKAEEELYELISEVLHPEWSKNPSFKEKSQFTKDSYLKINFTEQVVLKDRGDLVNEVILELKSGLVSQETALERINPDMDEEQLKEELSKIRGNLTVEQPNVDQVAEV